MIRETNPIASFRAGGSARWWLVVLLAGVAGALLVELGRARAVGGGLDQPFGPGRGLLVVPTALSRDSCGVYLVDPDQGKMCLYEYQSTHRQLRLVAVRNFTYDLRLDAYNTQPSPNEMRQLAEQLAPDRGAHDARNHERTDGGHPGAAHPSRGVAAMAKKMYYTDEEAAAKLGIDAAALEGLVRDQKLRAFKDGARIMFRADEIDALAAQGAPGEEEIELTPADTGGAGSISLVDSAETPPPAGKEDTVITAEGVSIFDEGEEVETADPLAKTQITARMEDQVSADGSGSGSGLLDLTRESDDTSLGEVLDKIEMDSGVAPIIEEAPAVVAAEPAPRQSWRPPIPWRGCSAGCSSAARWRRWCWGRWAWR